MKIGYFPNFYEDELIYSLLARYNAHSGMLCYRNVAENLFVDKKQKPDIEFINELREEVLEVLEREMPIRDLIIKHTMFPQYARFIDKERRDRAIKSLCNMNNDFRNDLVMCKNKKGVQRKLRYCPICSEHDRKEKGETYWRRSHQLRGVDICPIHKCRLVSSGVVIDLQSTPCLKTAEMEIPEIYEVIMSESSIEILLSEYIYKVFQLEDGYENDVSIGKFLHSRLTGTKYVSVRGENRNIALLYQDLEVFYKEVPIEGFTKLSQLQCLFVGSRFNMDDICRVALLLEIPPEELVYRELPEESAKERFDKMVLEMRKSGIGYNKIAKQLGVSSLTVRCACNQQPRKEKHYKIRCGKKVKDWNKIDREYLQDIRIIIENLNKDELSRPKKITKSMISKMLGCPNQKWNYLPLCEKEVLKYSETQEEYWAREIFWAFQKLKSENAPINWTRINKLINIRNQNLKACLPELEKLMRKEELGFLNNVLYDKL